MLKKKISISFLGVLTASIVFSASVFAGFSDIKGHWAESTILWAENKDIAGGYPDGSFKPDRSVTEAEFLALLIRAYDPNDRININAKIHWADGEYAYAMKKNYPTEGLANISKRNIAISRESVAEIIAGIQGANYSGKDAIHYLLGKGLAKGRGNVVSIEGYEGEGTLTRAESLAFIRNVLEKGIKDRDGNPIMQPRPKQPSSKEELPALPETPKEEKPTQPKPTTPIGSIDGKQLFDKTKDYAKELGFKTVEYVNTTGTFIENSNNVGLYFTHYPGYENGNAITFAISDWRNQNNITLFKKLLENCGVDSSVVIKAVNNLEVNSGTKMEAQGKVFSFNKRDNNGKQKVAFTVRDW